MTDTFQDKWSARQVSNPERGGLIEVEALETNDGTRVGDHVLYPYSDRDDKSGAVEVEMVVDNIIYLVPAGIDPYYRLVCTNAGNSIPTLRRVEGAERNFKKVEVIHESNSPKQVVQEGSAL